jgi:RHS repeat-associated protein
VAQTAQNFTATHNFQVIGTVLFNGAPLANVVFAATNGVTCTSSNASGLYSCIAPQGWSGTVTASLSGYIFTPATRHYSNVIANQSAQDYAAAPNGTYLVSGTVSVHSLPLANVTLAAANGGVCGPSNALGQYSCAVPPGWSGTVTPSASGYSFTPASRSLSNIVADQAGQDFAATMVSASAPMFFVHVDHLNTPRLAADATGTTVWKWDQQEPFGNSVADENPSGLGAFDLTQRLPGQYFDRETNFHYNYYRDYDPSIGRYLESDPIGLKGGLNTYVYVQDGPLVRTDPKGLAPVGPIPVDPNEAAVFYNFPDRYRKPSGGCMLDCMLKRQIMCIPMRIAGMVGGASVAAVGSFPSMGADFPVLAPPATAIGGNLGAGICNAYFFEKSCQEECSSCRVR